MVNIKMLVFNCFDCINDLYPLEYPYYEIKNNGYPECFECEKIMRLVKTYISYSHEFSHESEINEFLEFYESFKFNNDDIDIIYSEYYYE